MSIINQRQQIQRLCYAWLEAAATKETAIGFRRLLVSVARRLDIFFGAWLKGTTYLVIISFCSSWVRRVLK
jgi:hypothetical protein